MGCNNSTSQIANSANDLLQLYIEIIYPAACGWARPVHSLYKKIEKKYPGMLIDCKMSHEIKVISVRVYKNSLSR